MALTKEQKEALNAHFKDRELYDPSKHQEVATFLPKTMGHEKDDEDYSKAPGFSDGVETAPTDGMSVPIGADDASSGGPAQADPSGDGGSFWDDLKNSRIGKAVGSIGESPLMKGAAALTDPIGMAYNAGKSLGAPANPPLRQMDASIPAPRPNLTPPIAPQMPQASVADHGPSVDAPVASFNPHAGQAGFSSDPNAGASSNPTGLPNDQYAQLVAALTKGPNAGQIAASGAGALADGIMQGVARAGNPGFAKNIAEQQQNQRQNLINALREKYEAGFKGQELGLNQQKANDENTRAQAAIKAEGERSAAERATQERGQDIAAKTAGAERGVQTANQTREAAQAERANDMKIVQEYSPLKPGGYTEAQRDAAAARLKANGAVSGGKKAVTDNGHQYTVSQ